MLFSSIGYYALIFGLAASLPISFFAIKNFNPNIIFFHDMTTLSEQMIDKIDVELKELKLKIVSIGFPIENEQLYKKFDLVIFRYPDLYKKNNRLSKESMMLYHSFNNNIYEKLNFKKFKLRNNEINFIGGSYGLSKSFLEKSDYVISFSALTFPHKLFKILLIEQLYRSITIIQNKSYHK